MTTGREPSMGGDKRIDPSGAEPKLGGEAAILHLVEMLNHDDRKVRYRAALKLAESGDERVFDTLVEMLQDENGTPRLRERAAMALGQLGDERAIEPLMASLDIVPPHNIIKALSQIGEERAIEAARLAAYNHWHDGRVYRAIKETLPQLGGQWACEFLVSALENEAFTGTFVACGLAATLWQMGILDVERLLTLLNHESSHVRLLTLFALSQIKDERLVEPLTALLEDEPLVVRHVIGPLIELDGSQATSHLITLLNHENRTVVGSSILRLGELRDRRAVPPLIDIVSHPDLYPEDSRIVVIAMHTLGAIGDLRAVEPLLHILGSSDERLKSSAINALGKIGDPRAVKALGKALLEGDTEHSENLAIALAQIGTAEAMEILVTFIRQSQAADGYEMDTLALEETQGPQSMKSCIALLMHHPAPEVRRRTTRLMRSLPDERAVEALIEALDDRDDEVRRFAAFSLGEIGDDRAVEPLIAALHDSFDMVRFFAAGSLGEIGDNRAVEPLIQIVCNDQEAEHCRAFAAKALGKLGDRRAVEPLIDIITRRIGSLVEFDRSPIENAWWQGAIALGELGDGRAVEALTAVLYRANQARVECRESGNDSQAAFYGFIFSACHTALEQIGTPEALAAIEDLDFRDLGGEP